MEQTWTKRVRNVPSIADLDVRFKMMDLFNDYAQVICIGSPPIETFGPTPISAGLAKLSNDGMAELAHKFPKRFSGFIASLPMNDTRRLSSLAGYVLIGFLVLQEWLVLRNQRTIALVVGGEYVLKKKRHGDDKRR
jgi:hypothetical protein